jgi:hypothetical protein
MFQNEAQERELRDSSALVENEAQERELRDSSALVEKDKKSVK